MQLTQAMTQPLLGSYSPTGHPHGRTPMQSLPRPGVPGHLVLEYSNLGAVSSMKRTYSGRSSARRQISWWDSRRKSCYPSFDGDLAKPEWPIRPRPWFRGPAMILTPGR